MQFSGYGFYFPQGETVIEWTFSLFDLFLTVNGKVRHFSASRKNKDWDCPPFDS